MKSIHSKSTILFDESDLTRANVKEKPWFAPKIMPASLTLLSKYQCTSSWFFSTVCFFIHRYEKANVRWAHADMIWSAVWSFGSARECWRWEQEEIVYSFTQKNHTHSVYPLGRIFRMHKSGCRILQSLLSVW